MIRARKPMAKMMPMYENFRAMNKETMSPISATRVITRRPSVLVVDGMRHGSAKKRSTKHAMKKQT